jgi:hypothetical protein
MKTLKHLTLLACAAMLTLALPSCNLFGDDDLVGMDAADVKSSLIIGKWKNDGNSSNYKRYTTTSSKLSGHQDGSDWTIGETTEGQEGTEFYYKIEGNRLTEQHPTAGIYTPRQYTLMTLTSTKLEYFDSFNDVTSWTKQ